MQRILAGLGVTYKGIYQHGKIGAVAELERVRRHLLAVYLKRALSLKMMETLTGCLERQPIGG